MKRIYTKNNYLIIEWTGSNPLMRPKKEISFIRTTNNPNQYMIKDRSQAVPTNLQMVLWTDFVKEDGTPFTNQEEFTDWITANTGNFSSGSSIGEFEPNNYDLAEFSNVSSDPYIKQSEKPKDGEKGEKGDPGEQGIQGPQGIAGVNSFSIPTLRTPINKATAYQAIVSNKPAIIMITLSSTSSFSLTGNVSNEANIIMGSTNAVASGTGLVMAKYANVLGGGLVVGVSVTNKSTQTYTINLPAGYFFAILNANNTTGVTIDSVFEQTIG